MHPLNVTVQIQHLAKHPSRKFAFDSGTTMIDFEKGLYVTICEADRAPHPKPLANGFSERVAYRVLAIYNPSESGECWFVMSNDRDEAWFISQRHVRTFTLDAACRQFRFNIDEIASQEPNVIERSSSPTAVAKIG